MKISVQQIVLVAAFAFVIFVSMGWGCSNVVPYSFTSSTLHEYKYEGFSSIDHTLEYTTYPNHASTDSYLSNNIASAPSTAPAVKVSGYDGLLPSPASTDASIDTYSQAKGDTTCKSYGYMNSTGFLCMTPDQVKLLTTRGGNMSSGDAVIG